MKLWQIDQAVKGLCEDVEQRVRRIDFLDMTETQLVYELLVCILGSGVRYEISVAYATGINNADLVTKKLILEQGNLLRLRELLSSLIQSTTAVGTSYKSYRYPERGANYISQSLFNIYTQYGSLRTLINSGLEYAELRRELIRLCPGIGPKQASHFLKNAGYTDEVAILDRHIIRYMMLAGDNDASKAKLGSIKKYEEVENRFIALISKFQYSASVVDQSMWFVMRALSREALV